MPANKRPTLADAASAGGPVDWSTTGFPRTVFWLGAFVPLAVFKLVRLCTSLAFLILITGNF